MACGLLFLFVLMTSQKDIRVNWLLFALSKVCQIFHLAGSPASSRISRALATSFGSKAARKRSNSRPAEFAACKAWIEGTKTVKWWSKGYQRDTFEIISLYVALRTKANFSGVTMRPKRPVDSKVRSSSASNSTILLKSALVEIEWYNYHRGNMGRSSKILLPRKRMNRKSQVSFNNVT